MKLIIAGSRDITDHNVVVDALEKSGFEVESITEIVSGGARGVDRIAEDLSRLLLDKEATVFPAQWDKFPRAAGHIRNAEMAEYADALIAVWDGKSPGTKNMIDTALSAGLKVYVHPATG